MNVRGFFGGLFGSAGDPAHEISRFAETIRLHEDQLFGITLFMEGIRVLYAGQPTIIEMNQRSLNSVRERAQSAITGAKALLEDAKRDPTKVRDLRTYPFPPISGHPALDVMTQRARILVQTYERLFPQRPRETPLLQDELARLMTEASGQL